MVRSFSLRFVLQNLNRDDFLGFTAEFCYPFSFQILSFLAWYYISVTSSLCIKCFNFYIVSCNYLWVNTSPWSLKGSQWNNFLVKKNTRSCSYKNTPKLGFQVNEALYKKWRTKPTWRGQESALKLGWHCNHCHCSVSWVLVGYWYLLFHHSLLFQNYR